jgi:hypothetical protein
MVVASLSLGLMAGEGGAPVGPFMRLGVTGL